MVKMASSKDQRWQAGRICRSYPRWVGGDGSGGVVTAVSLQGENEK